MPTISNRGEEMPESPIRKLAPYAEQAVQKGIHVYHLNIGQPDLAPSENTLSVIRNTQLSVIGYSHSAGNASYRKKLAAYYNKIDIPVDQDEILITTGGSEAIAFAFNACMNPGDEVIIPEPFYANYLGFAVSTGVKVVPITSSIDDGFALPPIEEFEKLITKKTKAILVNNPNNPTGYIYSKVEIEKLADIARRYDLYLIADEVYRTLCYVNEPFFSVMHLKGMDDHLIMIDSASKRFNACGLRVGAFVSKNKKLIATALKYGQARLSPPHFGQIAGEAALDSSSLYLDTIFETFKSRRDFLVEALNKMEHVFCPTPKGAFYVMARLPIDDSDEFCKWLLNDFSYKGQTVMFAPATGFYSTKGLGKNEVRMAYVLDVKDLKNAMECLEAALKVYPGRLVPKS